MNYKSATTINEILTIVQLVCALFMLCMWKQGRTLTGIAYTLVSS